MNPLHKKALKEALTSSWDLKKSRSHSCMIVGKQGTSVSMLLSIVGDEHWDNEFHELVIYQIPAQLLSKGSHGKTAGDSWRFHYWNDLLAFLNVNSALDFKRELVDYV